MTAAYPRYPAICRDQVVFAAEDDLWSVPVSGGTASRLTAGSSAAGKPALSPDGSLLAYVGTEDGPEEVYVMSAEGGPSRRLTFQGASVYWVGWDDAGEHIRYSTNAGSPHRRRYDLWQVPSEGGDPKRLPWGIGLAWQTDGSGLSVIAQGHPTRGAAYQKRYRGGTAGRLWVDVDGSGEYRQFAGPAGFLECPQLVDGRVCFLSDHEGVGNVYSALPDGSDLRRHSDHADFYARDLSGDGRQLAYRAGGELYTVRLDDDQPRKLDARILGTQTQRARKFVPADKYLHAAALSPDGAKVAMETRGKLFALGNWDGPVLRLGDADGTCYRLPTWLCDGKRLVAAASDAGPDETLAVLDAEGLDAPRLLDKLDVGRAVELAASPTQDKVAVCNHRGELVMLDLTAAKVSSQVVDRSEFGDFSDPQFSPDGRWLAYAAPQGVPDETEASGRTKVMLLEVESGTMTLAATPVLSDERPHFDPSGDYLYFIGRREFNPSRDQLDFNLGFMCGTRPYAVALRKDVPAPFVATPRPVADDKSDGADDVTPAISVDVDGLSDRVTPFPIAEARYERVYGIKGKALVLSRPPKPTPDDLFGRPVSDRVLESVDLVSGETETLLEDVADVWLGPDGTSLLCRSDGRLRVVEAGTKASDDDEPGRNSGWIDMDRVKVSVLPEAEWPQMFAEAWRLQSHHFWMPDMGGTDWDEVYRRYAPLAERVASRGDFSDLVWEMQGELACSHAYEMFGDYRSGPQNQQGLLGAEFAWDASAQTCRVERILQGDRWSPRATSALNRPGVNVSEGDAVLAVNGQPVTEHDSVGKLLVNQAGQEVQLTVKSGQDAPRTVVVQALDDELPIRYRDWVDGNRRAVAEASGGRVGYLHVPDMVTEGYAEFVRGYLGEHRREAMVIDLRFNGGGNVSTLVLDRLSRPGGGYVWYRRNRPFAYPPESKRGPLVAVTNEYAGSDGDLGSYGFKYRGLGPLVGKRTWGGVVGIRPRHRLADDTMVTQPEAAIHYDGIGNALENYGVDPDVEVELAPQDYAAGTDPQLDKAVELALKQLGDQPAVGGPDRDWPRLAAPALPPRPQDSR